MRVDASMVLNSGVTDGEHCADNEETQCGQKARCQCFMQQQEPQRCPKKRRYGIIGAGCRSSQHTLRPYVGENARSIRDKSKSQCRTDECCRRGRFSDQSSGGEGAESGEDALDGYNLIGALIRNPACAVVFQSSAYSCSEDQQGSGREM